MTPAHPSTAEDPFDHPALFYSGPDEYLAGTVPFIEEGLSADEPVAVAVPERNLSPLRDALGSSAEGVHMLDMTEVGANPGRIIPGVLRAFADAHPDRRVRIIGEPIWPGRSEIEYPACAQHEALINFAFTGRAVTILCPYDTDGLHPQVIDDARATHPVLVDRDGRRRSDKYDPGRIVGDHNQPLSRPPQSAVERVVDRAALDGVRRFLAAYGRESGLADDRIVDLEIAATELLTNSVHHGGGTGTLRVWTDGQQLICEVSDTGHITDPLAGRRPPGADFSQGHGLLLVNHIVDLVRIHTGPLGTTVRIHLWLTRQEPRAVATHQR